MSPEPETIEITTSPEGSEEEEEEDVADTNAEEDNPDDDDEVVEVLQPPHTSPLSSPHPIHEDLPPQSPSTPQQQDREEEKQTIEQPQTIVLDIKPEETKIQIDPSTPPATTTLEVPAQAPAPKPKSTKGPGLIQRSPSPAPPAPPPPRPTIRIDIKLGGPSDYEVDIRQLSKENGFLPNSPTRPTVVSESEGEDEPEPEVKVSKRGRKSAAQEYYDLHDPFIDDAELEVDERKFMAQTKQKGFYVSAGEVQLLKDKTVPNSKVGGKNAAGGSPLKIKPMSGRDKSPIAFLEGSEDEVKQGPGGGRKRLNEDWLYESARKKRRTLTDPFSPETEKLIAEMKELISKEKWEAKGKFPPALKPPLSRLAYQAILNDEYDDAFFALMPKLFPYNKFTMTKLIKRLVYQDHYALLLKRQDEKLEDLKKVADEGFAKAQEEYDRAVVLWEKRVQRAKEAQQDQLGGDGTPGDNAEEPAPPPPPPPPTQKESGGDDAMDVDGDLKTLEGLSNKDTHQPPRKYRMTERIRQLLWELVQLSNESVRITNEKNTLENNSETVSEQGVRKGLYQRIVSAFPDGWMNSGNISREVSALKKKLEKEEEGA